MPKHASIPFGQQADFVGERKKVMRKEMVDKMTKKAKRNRNLKQKKMIGKMKKKSRKKTKNLRKYFKIYIVTFMLLL